jgi:hypothetical protein
VSFHEVRLPRESCPEYVNWPYRADFDSNPLTLLYFYRTTVAAWSGPLFVSIRKEYKTPQQRGNLA